MLPFPVAVSLTPESSFHSIPTTMKPKKKIAVVLQKVQDLAIS
jgi:hypothetical protein